MKLCALMGEQDAAAKAEKKGGQAMVAKKKGGQAMVANTPAGKAVKVEDTDEARFACLKRFPERLWSDAIEFLSR